MNRRRNSEWSSSSARMNRSRSTAASLSARTTTGPLGSYERGLVGDLGLLKLSKALRGRWVEADDTAELLEPYEEWQGLASVYLLRGFARGLIPLPERAAAA